MATLTVNTSLADGAVTNAKLADMAQGTLKGRAAGAGTGDPQDLTPDQASAVLDAATDPFVRTSNLPIGTGDVVGPASSTDNNVPQWDGTTGKLLKDGRALSQGGNGAFDSGKIAIYSSTGQLAAGVDNGAAIRGISVNDEGVHGTSDSGSALYGNTTGDGSIGLRLTHAGSTGEFIRCWNGGADQQFVVDRLGAISWPNGGTGPATTRNNILPSKAGNFGKVLRVNLAETDYELVDGVVDGGTLTTGLTFPNAGLKIADNGADHTLVLVVNEDLTADRQLTILVNDANRSISLGANLDLREGGDLRILTGAGGPRIIDLDGDLTVPSDATVSGINTGDQDLSGLMVKANNLSDVSSVSTARDNLGLIRRKITTATTGVSTSYTDVTDLSFPVVAGTTYTFTAAVLAECSNTGGGVCLTANGPAATWFAARYEGNQTSGGSIIRSDITAYDSMGTLADPNTVTAANTPYTFTLQGVLVPSANGTFTLRVKRGGGSGNIAVRAGTLEATAM